MKNTEKVEKHLQALKERHKALDLQIVEENSHPSPKDALIQELKKQKLKVKEEIRSIEDANK